MKNLLLLIFLALALTQCKDNSTPDPLPEIAGIAGVWRVAETQYISPDTMVVTKTGTEPQPVFSIRYDGVMLYDGYGTCCAATKYVINGTPFDVKPQSAIPMKLNCALVDCWACPTVTIIHSGDEMTINQCDTYITKYIRIK